ncbi:hypothetical protein SO694_00117033 [Aureococcus anophagefferens]|uniref:Uncharacterized protein n=1 Tax=Aureococcus anophagefferens TaxID=44056 RepID=A0ABR1FWI4_AURAN
MGKQQDPTTPKSPFTRRRLVGKSARGSPLVEARKGQPASPPKSHDKTATAARNAGAQSSKEKTITGHKVTTTASGSAAAAAAPVDATEFGLLVELWSSNSDGCVAEAARARAVAVADAGGAAASPETIRAVAGLLRGAGKRDALRVLAALAGHAANRGALVDAGAIEIFVEALDRSDTNAARERAAWALGALTDGSSRKRVGQAAIPALVTPLLRSESSDQLQFQCAAALWRLGFDCDENRERIALAGASKPLIALRRTGSGQCQAAAKGALCNLTPHVRSRRILADALGLDNAKPTKFDVDSAIVTPRPLFA